MGVKVKIVGSDIFTGKKYESVVPGDGTVQVPVVTKKEYQLMAIDDDSRRISTKIDAQQSLLDGLYQIQRGGNINSAKKDNNSHTKK